MKWEHQDSGLRGKISKTSAETNNVKIPVKKQWRYQSLLEGVGSPGAAGFIGRRDRLEMGFSILS
ncbi:uncharacterized protein J3R85_005716 [Psidium guajava]|nr:uncharacterized protein J3R85_005716 [Psidium guajava]